MTLIRTILICLCFGIANAMLMNHLGVPQMTMGWINFFLGAGISLCCPPKREEK